MQDQIQNLKNKLSDFSKVLHISDKKERILELTKLSENPDLWQDQEKAVNINSELADLSKEIEEYDTLELLLNSESLSDSELSEVSRIYQELEFKILLSGPYDDHGVILSIHAGTGGVDAMDWAMILERMYLRYIKNSTEVRSQKSEVRKLFYIDRSKWQVQVVERTMGEEAGIKSATIIINGRYAFGLLKKESGVHRLVRLSPFNAKNLRQTSFALVEVIPFLSDTHPSSDNLIISDKDLKIDTFRSSGAGGQHVNVTDSAVRITHIPTGIVVSVQNERSQYQNKETALNILRSKLHVLLETEKKEKIEELRGEHKQAIWGNQIRSYVLAPYKLVKDHRTEYETSDVDGVLDGKLDGFIEAELKQLENRK